MSAPKLISTVALRPLGTQAPTRDVVEGGNAVGMHGIPCIREMRGGTSMAAHAEAAPGCIGGGGSSANTPNTAANAAAKVALMCRIVCGRRGAISGHDLNWLVGWLFLTGTPQ
jgi:hypothetical protein